MDPVKLEKIKAMNKYKNQLLLNNLILYSLTILVCTLFCSSPFWYPPPFSCIKLFIFVSLPQINSLFFSPKFLFIVSNLIIIILLGESKILSLHSSSSPPSSSPPSPSPIEVYYSKCVSESKSRSDIRSVSYTTNKQKAKIEKYYEEIIYKDEALERERVKNTLPAEDLNKRADDFIARVNRQRKLEAAFY